MIPTGTELARPFVPARDFTASKRFYQALEFPQLLDSDVAIFQVGASSFVLQPYAEPGHEGHLMMQLMVDDLDAWWAHLEALELRTRFDLAVWRPPALQPWGLRVAFLSDPSGVLWHIAERRPGVVHDR